MTLVWTFESAADRRAFARSAQGTKWTGFFVTLVAFLGASTVHALRGNWPEAAGWFIGGLLFLCVFHRRNVQHAWFSWRQGHVGAVVSIEPGRVVTYSQFGRGRLLVTDFFEPIDFPTFERKGDGYELFHNHGPTHELDVSAGFLRDGGARKEFEDWLGMNGVVELVSSRPVRE